MVVTANWQVCKCVPESTGFDVEIKFPTPIEEQSYRVQVCSIYPFSFLIHNLVIRLIGILFVIGIKSLP